MKPEGTGIIYLCKDRIYLYCNLLPTIIEGRFSGRAVKNHMVPDENHFTEEVIEFLEKNNVPKSKMIIVLADEAAMMKEFTTPVINQLEVDGFLQSVPYPEKVTKTIQREESLLIFIANKHLLKMLKKAVELAGFTIESVLPASIIAPDLGKQQKLSLEMSSEIFARTLSLQEYNLLPPPLPEPLAVSPASNAEREQRRHDILRLYAYTTIFGLLVIAIVVVWNVQNPGPSQTYRGKANQLTPTISLASPSATIPSLDERKKSSVKIINYSGNVDLAKKIQKQLINDHFQSVSIENKPVSAAKTTIIYAGSVSQEIRDVIFTDVNTYERTISVQVSVKPQTPITIILGK